MNKNEGLYKKFEVVKVSNPEKVIDAIVLEFDDPIARGAILKWACDMDDAGYKAVFNDVMEKLGIK